MDTTINLTTTGTATTGTDYTGTAATVTILAGQTTGTVTINPTTDTLVEADETVILTIDPGTGYTVGTPASATGTITNDDIPVATIAVAPASVTEDGVTNLVYTVTLDTAALVDTTINLTTTGTATTGTDYTGTAATVTILAGQTTGTVTINPTTDTLVEADETVILTIDPGTGYTVGTPASATGTITNDDIPVASITVAPASVTEDGVTNLVYTVTLNTAPLVNTTINLTTTGTATTGTDYTGTAATVTILAGQTTGTVTINPTTDTVVEADETVILTIDLGAGYTVGTPASATGTITNDDIPVATITVAPASATEDGAIDLVYTVTLNAAPLVNTTINLTTTGIATTGTDYTGSVATVTILAGQTTGTVTINPTTDTLVEADETVILTIDPGAGYTVGVPASATGTITNDDIPVATITVAPASATEDGAIDLVYTVALNAAPLVDTTINLTTTGTATTGTDYTGTAVTVTILAGQTTGTVTINPTADTVVEADETVILTIDPGTGYTVGTPSVATGTITNDDIPVATITVAPASVTEDGVPNLVYTVTLDKAPLVDTTINLTTTGTATTGTDYTGTAATVTILAGQTTGTVTINPTTDTLVEADETVILTIDPGTGYTVGVPASATGTITNDDTTPFPSLGLVKTDGVGSVIAGGTTTYSLTVSNLGNAATSGTITIVDVLPAGLSIADGVATLGGVNAADWSCNSASNIITCVSSTPITAANGTSVFSFTVNVAWNAGGTLLNKAQVGGGGDPLTSTPTSTTAANCTATDNPTKGCATDSNTWTPQADLTLAKTVDNPSPKVGDNITYTLTLTNNGPSNATNVTVADTLPAGLTFVSAVPSSGTSFVAPTWTIPSLTANSSATLQLNVLVTQVGGITNTAQVTSSDQPDPNSANNQASASIGGLFDPPTAIKTINAAGLPELEFRMVWINSGNTSPIDVQVTDQIPTGTAYVAGSLTCVPLGSSLNAAIASSPLSATAVPSSFCGYDSVANRIQWQGSMGPDNGNLTEAAAVNEVVITFRATVDGAVNQVQNQGFSRTDVDSDGNFDEETVLGSSLVGSNVVVWNRSPSVPGNPGNGTNLPRALPATGFAPNVVTTLPKQSAEKTYAATDVWLELPSLGVKVPIVGVPLVDNKWDLSWLGSQAGWLDGTAFPSWQGNSALTGHVTLSNGKSGPFANLGGLKWGDKIIVHAYGSAYTYEVRENKTIAPNDTSVLKHEDNAWLTLITCKTYSETKNTYANRISVRAVLLSIAEEGGGSRSARGR